MLVRWMGFVAGAAWLVVAFAALSLAGSAWHVATHVRMNTDTVDMLSPELGFRRHQIELAELFPQFSDNILVVVDGPDADGVSDAADALAQRLRGEPELFGSVFDPLSEPFFRRNGLLFLDEEELLDLSARLARAQPLLGTLWRDPSLPGFLGVLGQALEAELDAEDAPPIEIDFALDAVASVVEAQIAGEPGRLSWQELMAGGALDSGDRRRLLLLQPAVDYGSLAPATEALEKLRSIAAELQLERRHGARVRLTGSVPLAQEELASVAAGMGMAAVLSVILVLGLLLWGLRSVRLVGATLFTLLVGLAWTAEFATVAIGMLNLLSVAFAVLFIGLSVDFGIHFGLRYQEEIDAGAEHLPALEAAASGVGGSLTLAAVAAALAFFSFLPTAYQGLAELGLIAGVGMFVALFTNLTVLPAALSLSPPRARPRRAPKHRGGEARFARLHARGIVIAAGVLAVASLPMASRVHFAFDPFDLRDAKTESVATLAELMEDPRTSPYTITVISESVEAAESLGDRLEALPEVDGTATLADYVPDGQDEKLAILDATAMFLLPAFVSGQLEPVPDDDARARAVAEFRALLARRGSARAEGSPPASAAPASVTRLDAALSRLDTVGDGRALVDLERRLLAGLPGRLAALLESLEAAPVTRADLPDSLRVRQVTADGRARLQVFPTENLHDTEALRRFVRAVRALAPRATGGSVIIYEAGITVVRAFVEAATLSVIAVALLLALVLRRIRDVVLVFVPLVLAGLLTIDATVLLGLSFNFANLVVLPLQFGLGVAGAVHLVLRQRESAGDALATSTPRGVAFSGLTTIGSFGTIALSSHPGTASMGILLTLAVMLTLACTLLVLPALLAFLDRAEEEPR